MKNIFRYDLPALDRILSILAFIFWLSRLIEGKIRFGSFARDAKGHCGSPPGFVNLVIEDADRGRIATGKEVGINLGLKTIATLSDGKELDRENLTKKYEQKLAMAQRANKKKLVTAIHTKISIHLQQLTSDPGDL